VIYYWTAAEDVCYMLYAYAKNEQGDLTRAQIRVLARLVREEFTRSHCFASRRATPKRWRTRCTSLRSAVRHNVRWNLPRVLGKRRLRRKVLSGALAGQLQASAGYDFR